MYNDFDTANCRCSSTCVSSSPHRAHESIDIVRIYNTEPEREKKKRKEFKFRRSAHSRLKIEDRINFLLLFLI